MSFASVLAEVEAQNRAVVRVETFGHLAPRKGEIYQGHIVFAVPEFDSGNPCIVSAEFEGLNDSPWLYEAMIEFAERKTKAGVYRFDGTVRNYKFKGTITRIDTGVKA